jgi:YHS domain-containing protein
MVIISGLRSKYTKMKNSKILAIMVLIFTTVSCEKKEEIKVHQVNEEQMQTVNKLDVKVVNANDPVCGMSTAEHLSDTIQYNGKIYGFCSETCKNEFAKNPEKYLKK